MSSSHKDPSRRDVLHGGTAGLSLIALGGPALAQNGRAALEQYKPVFFSDAEWTFVKAATARLIPEDGEGPGALETHVPVFIDRQLAGPFGDAAHWYMDGPHDVHASSLFGFQSPDTPAQIYRKAIKALNEYCTKTYGARFAELSPADQDTILTAVENGDIKFSNVSMKWFFKFLVHNTKEGYFADPMYGGNFGMAAWVYVGFPGARASFREWVDQYDKPYPLGPVSIKGERA